MINRKKRNIVVFGAGYVGLSVAVFLSEKNNVCIFDIDQEKIAKLLNADRLLKIQKYKNFLKWKKQDHKSSLAFVVT